VPLRTLFLAWHVRAAFGQPRICRPFRRSLVFLFLLYLVRARLLNP
jgi:hypothetical protein